MAMQIRLKGVRGSLPVHAPEFAVYGGATSCIWVKAGEENIILDAGTGLRGDLGFFSSSHRFTLLLTHPHIDHLMGLPLFSPLFDKHTRFDIYLPAENGPAARQQIEQLMSPPLWPVSPDAFGAAVEFHASPARFTVGDVTVETLTVPHPGRCVAYKLTRQGRSLVYATDLEIDGPAEPFLSFAGRCDLLLLDAQYTEEEYAVTKGFGHNTVSRSISLARQCNAGKTIFIHHDPGRTDNTLSAWDSDLASAHPSMHFGRQGEEVLL